MKNIFILITLLLSLVISTLSIKSYAHDYNDSYLTINQNTQSMTLEWSVALDDLMSVLTIDHNDDGIINASELKQSANEINRYMMNDLSITSRSHQETQCSLTITDTGIKTYNNKPYYTLLLLSDCEIAPQFVIDYRLFKSVNTDSAHSVFVNYKLKTKTVKKEIITLLKNNQLIIDTTTESNLWHNTINFIIEGIWHIWIGFDHILFLLVLLLPVVLIYQNRQWQAEEKLSTAIKKALLLTTCFTLSHSITLSLSILNIVNFSAIWIEVMIATSVIIVALHHFKPLFSKPEVFFCLFFGLIHGFGFANVLLDLSLQKETLFSSLIGFNIGIEIGQILIIALVFPIIFFARKYKIYRNAIVPIGMITAITISSLWFIERMGQAMIFAV